MLQQIKHIQNIILRMEKMKEVFQTVITIKIKKLYLIQ